MELINNLLHIIQLIAQQAVCQPRRRRLLTPSAGVRNKHETDVKIRLLVTPPLNFFAP